MDSGEYTQPAPVSSGNVATDLLSSTRNDPDKIALVDRDAHEVPYAELLQRTALLVSRLAGAGVQPGDRVVIAARSTIGHVAAWYAILGLGAISVDLNFLLGDEECAYILTNCSPKVVIAEEPFTSRLRAVAHSTTVFLSFEGPPQASSGWTPCLVDGSDPAVIAYTSGTTGLPKGVVHTHGGISSQLRLLEKVVGYDSSWVIYQSIPLFSLHGFLPQIATTVHVGGTAILAEKFDPAAFAEVSLRYPITYTTLSSPMVPRLIAQVKQGESNLSNIRVLSCGGAPLHPELSAEFRRVTGIPLTQGYGMTEMLGAFVMDLDGEAPWGASGRSYPREEPVLCIVDDDGRRLDPAEAGEIVIDSRFVTERYWPVHPVDLLDGRWFRTGDIGRIDDQGFVYLLDRKKDVVIRGGFNIYTAEIERVLMSNDWVEEATVIGVSDERVGEVPVAYVVVAEGAPETIGDLLLTEVSGRLGRLKRPEELQVVEYDDLPRNALGKVQKAVLRERSSTFSVPR